MSDSTVAIFRLNSGEEIVADYKEGEDSYTLTHPALILPGGSGKIVLAPFMPYADHTGGIEFPKRSILFFITPHKDLYGEYEDYFGKNAGKPKIWKPDTNLAMVGVNPDVRSRDEVPPSNLPTDGPISGSNTPKLKLT